MTDKRVLLVSEDGTAEVNGVKGKFVPEDATWAMQCAGTKHDTEDEHADIGADVSGIYRAMLSAAAIDLSSLPRVPECKTDDIGSTYTRGWNACLDAMGVKE